MAIRYFILGCSAIAAIQGFTVPQRHNRLSNTIRLARSDDEDFVPIRRTRRPYYEQDEEYEEEYYEDTTGRRTGQDDDFYDEEEEEEEDEFANTVEYLEELLDDWDPTEHAMFGNEIVPNALLDNIDPDGAADRFPELARDPRFWFEMLLFVAFLDFLSVAGPMDPIPALPDF